LTEFWNFQNAEKELEPEPTKTQPPKKNGKTYGDISGKEK